MKKLLGILLLTGATFLTGCGDSDNFVFTDNNGIIVAPVCVDDAYTTNSNTPLAVTAANGVLANDTTNGATITFPATSAQNGTVVGLADGSFTYTPAANFVGQDTFSYNLTNSAGTVTCTVTITVNAVNGFFVDAANGNDATGNFTNGLPFATIQAAITAAPAGSDIVVRPGNYAGTITLDNGDRLLGSGSVLAQGAVPRPVLTGPIVLGDGCTVDFVRIDGTTSDAIDGNGQTGGTVTNCEVANITGGVGTNSGINVEPGIGNWTISNNTIDNVAGIGINICTVNNDTARFIIGGNTISNSGLGAIALLSENSSQLNASVVGNIMTTSGVTGFELICADDSTFCLDLETNSNDDEYAIIDSNIGTAVLSIEQLSTLGTPQPGGAGNVGTISIASGGIADPPVDVADGFCGF